MRILLVLFISFLGAIGSVFANSVTFKSSDFIFSNNSQTATASFAGISLTINVTGDDTMYIHPTQGICFSDLSERSSKITITTSVPNETSVYSLAYDLKLPYGEIATEKGSGPWIYDNDGWGPQFESKYGIDRIPFTYFHLYFVSVEEVTANIDAIGNIKYKKECYDLIHKARYSYNNLSDELKAKITNYEILKNAETKYASLKNTIIDSIILKIDSIGTVEYTEKCKKLIDESRNLCNLLVSSDDINDITNYQTLKDAEKKFSEIKIINVNSVTNKIWNIGMVEYTERCKNLIKEARSSYDALLDDHKTDVIAYKDLLYIETEYTKLENAKDSVVTMINSIKTVEYTDTCKTLLENTREAYETLNDSQKVYVSNYQILIDAEKQYANLKEISEENGKYTMLTYSVANQGSISAKVKKGEFTLYIVPEKGWEVSTLRVNGADSLYALRDSILKVNLEYETTVVVNYKWADEDNLFSEVDENTGIITTKSFVKVYTKDKVLYVEPKYESISIFTVNGALITKQYPTNEIVQFNLPSGVYIVKVGNEAIKITVK